MTALATAVGAAAQDSVSCSGGEVFGPQPLAGGDGLSPFDLASQRTAYVVDLVEVRTSRGIPFVLGPVSKLGRSGTPGLGSRSPAGQVISRDLLPAVEAFSLDYLVWQGQPGAGVNASENCEDVDSVAGPAVSRQLAIASLSFGGDADSVVTSILNISDEDPDRVYVTRIQSALSSASLTESAVSRLGLGGVDARGNTLLRSDDFGLSGDGVLTGNRVVRVRSGDRNPSVLNVLGANADERNATDLIAIEPAPEASGASSPLAAPFIVGLPALLAGGDGGNGTALVPGFGGRLWTGSSVVTPNTFASTSGAGEARGSLGLSTPMVSGLAVASQVLLGENGPQGIVLAGIDPGGGVVFDGPVVRPGEIADGLDGRVEVYGPGSGFVQYRSAASLRGTPGVTAVAVEADSAVRFASLHSAAGSTVDRSGSILAGMLFGDAQWSIAAWADAGGIDADGTNQDDLPAAMRGKPVYGIGNDVVGYLTTTDRLAGRPSDTVPLSNPGIDGAGNVWFIGVFEPLDAEATPARALFRAVLEDDPGGYRVERVLGEGDIVEGLNSGVAYQITRLHLSDGGGVAAGSLGSGSVRPAPWDADGPLDAEAAALRQDPRSLGGLVFAAEITYDVDGDGVFGSAFPDERYNATMFLSPKVSGGQVACNDADLVAPFGIVNSSDINAFIAGFLAGDLSSDLAEPIGILNASDINAFVDGVLFGCGGSIGDPPLPPPVPEVPTRAVPEKGNQPVETTVGVGVGVGVGDGLSR
ncbi:MAG: hypothetical protein AAF235_05335 [Planctomycetota bacterium]